MILSDLVRVGFTKPDGSLAIVRPSAPGTQTEEIQMIARQL
jgi:hypothetical protein